MADFTTIDECINLYIDRSEQDNTKYYKLWRIAFSGMEQLGLDFFYRVKSIKIPVNANLTVSLPADYLNYTKVGILNAKGEVIPLKYNEKLTAYADLFPDRKSKTEDNELMDFGLFGTSMFYNYWNGYDFTTLYGLPSGSPWVGSFKIDHLNQVILLGEHFQYDYIILEYLATPPAERGGNYLLPVQFKEALIAYIGWQDIMYMNSSRKGNLGDKEQRKRNYYNERRLAIARYKPFRKEQAYEWNLENQRLTVKG